MNPFDKEVKIFIHESSSAYMEDCTTIQAEHEKSGITVKIRRPRDRASLLDMRAEALNELEYLVTNSPRYARILKDIQRENSND